MLVHNTFPRKPLSRMVEAEVHFNRAIGDYEDSIFKSEAAYWRMWAAALAVSWASRNTDLSDSPGRPLGGLAVELTDDMLYRARLASPCTPTPSHAKKATRRAKARTKRTNAR